MNPSRATDLPFVDVQALRVGMVVQLETGWLRHPFLRSRFRIASEDEIRVLRELGLQRVRWSPHDSDPAPAAQPLPRPTEPGPQARREARRRELQAEREALAACERQFRTAGGEFCRMVQTLRKEPEAAGVMARQLAGWLADKMPPARDLCIRLLPDTAGDAMPDHSINVAVLSQLIARGMGWPREDLVDIGMGGVLHDIGKPEDLRQRVYERPEAHVARGVAAGIRMGLPESVLEAIAEHHEAADGSGYPKGLRNDQLSLAGRIVAVANRYDNLCNAPDLSQALTPHEALSELFKRHGAQHDPTILGAFVGMVGIYPAGSVLQLTDGRHALVVAVNSARSVRPRVLVHDPALPEDEALFLDIDPKGGGVGIRRALRAADLPAQAREYLRPRRRLAYCVEPAESHPPR